MGNQITLLRVTENTCAMVAFVLSVPRGSLPPRSTTEIREAAAVVVKEWAQEIFDGGGLALPAGEACIRLARKYAQWAEKELRGITLTPALN